MSIARKYGVSGAILTANTLLFFVPELISEFGRKSKDAILLSRLLELFGESYRSSTLGEYLDLEMAGSSSKISESDYEEMIRLKTGSLIGAASASGALIGKGSVDEDLISAAYGYGESLGIAYQVQDDLLDIFGEEETIGKPIFSDIASGKKSLVLIRFLTICNDAESDFIEGILRRKQGAVSGEEIARTRQLLRKYDCDSYAREFALRRVQHAQSTLGVLKDSTARDRLSELSFYLAERKY